MLPRARCIQAFTFLECATLLQASPLTHALQTERTVLKKKSYEKYFITEYNYYRFLRTLYILFLA